MITYKARRKTYSPKQDHNIKYWFYDTLSGVWFKSTIGKVHKMVNGCNDQLIRKGYLTVEQYFARLEISEFVNMLNPYICNFNEDDMTILGWSIDTFFCQTGAILNPFYDPAMTFPLHIRIETDSPYYICPEDYIEYGDDLNFYIHEVDDSDIKSFALQWAENKKNI